MNETARQLKERETTEALRRERDECVAYNAKKRG